MNPTQMICANCKGELPKVGGIEIREHRPDGKTAYYTCGLDCGEQFMVRLMKAKDWAKEQSQLIEEYERIKNDVPKPKERTEAT